jgi:2-oxoglutarate ferredoxin oxidoreductase subunit beta
MAFDYNPYIREGKLPHIWCPGCTYGIVFKSLIRSLDAIKQNKDDLAVVSGIGCASRLPGYIDANTLHTAHGRALTFATGVKMVKPEKRVIALSGDGDATAIGGNHFIHACRRNIDITVLVLNNYIYGMTGGQHSPTTPKGHTATTMPYGNIDPNFDIASLAIGAGASFVARGTAYHVPALDKILTEAIQHKGLSVVEIINACPTTHGRRNKFKNATDQLLWMKDSFMPKAAFDKLPAEQTAGKLPLGVLFKKENAAEYCETYFGMTAGVRAKMEGRA